MTTPSLVFIMISIFLFCGAFGRYFQA